MGFIHNLFHWRQKEESGELVDVYTYDKLPEKLRNQICLIMTETLDPAHSREENYREIQRGLIGELGVHELNRQPDPRSELVAFLLQHQKVDEVLSGVEMTFRKIQEFGDQNRLPGRHLGESRRAAQSSVEALNTRLEQNRIGYFYESGQIMRRDNQAVHQLAVLPALTALQAERFSGPNLEFLDAHDHYRNGRFEDCLVNCGKALESTMKIICDGRQWAYDPDRDTVSKLIDILKNNGLIESYMMPYFQIPGSIRNKQGGHGRGAARTSSQAVPKSLTEFGVAATASAIAYLAKADEEMP